LVERVPEAKSGCSRIATSAGNVVAISFDDCFVDGAQQSGAGALAGRAQTINLPIKLS
jgi:hypothetical protein